MNRAGHVTSSALAGMATVPLVLAHPNLGDVFAAGVVTAGGGVVPDLDHLHATATRSLGPLTRGASHLLRGLSTLVYRITAGRRDADGAGKHRHLTHTLIFAALLGGAVTWGCHAAATWQLWAGIVACLVVVAFLVDLAASYFGWWVLLAPVALAWSVFEAPGLHTGVTQLAAHLGVWLAIGCAAHDVGDALTEEGAPLLWPLPLRGRTWYDLKLLGPLSFHAGSAVENRVLVPLFLTLFPVAGVSVLYPALAAEVAHNAVAALAK